MIVVDILILLITFYVILRIVEGPFLQSLDNISNFLGLSPSVAGATLLAMGTSAPEIATAMISLFDPNINPSTGIGAVIGSAIFQITVVIGFAAFVKTSYLNWRPILRDTSFYAVSIILLVLVLIDGVIDLQDALLLVIGYFVYLFILFLYTRFVQEEIPAVEQTPKAQKKSDGFDLPPILTNLHSFAQKVAKPIDWMIERLPDPHKNKGATIPVFIISLCMIALACYFMVVSAERFAFALGISPVIVALTILAGGSSVPEMISSAVVSKQGRGDMAISNAIGSNIFDVLLSLGIPLLIYNIAVGELQVVDQANITSSVFLLFVTLIGVISMLMFQRFKATRTYGLVLISTYIVYVLLAYIGII